MATPQHLNGLLCLHREEILTVRRHKTDSQPVATPQHPIIRQRLEIHSTGTLPHHNSTARYQKRFPIRGNIINVGVQASVLPQECLHTLSSSFLICSLPIFAGDAVVTHRRTHPHIARKMQIPSLGRHIRPYTFLAVKRLCIRLRNSLTIPIRAGRQRRTVADNAAGSRKSNSAIRLRPRRLNTPTARIILHNKIRTETGNRTLQIMRIEIHDLRKVAGATHFNVPLRILLISAHMVPHTQPATRRSLTVLQQFHQTIRLRIVLNKASGNKQGHGGIMRLGEERPIPPIFVATDGV